MAKAPKAYPACLCRRFLSTQPVGHLATADNQAIPQVVPVCFVISL